MPVLIRLALRYSSAHDGKGRNPPAPRFRRATPPQGVTLADWLSQIRGVLG